MDGKFTYKDDIQKISRKIWVDRSIPWHGDDSVIYNSRSKSNKKRTDMYYYYMKTSALHLIYMSYISPILQVRKLRLGEIKYHAEVHTVNGRDGIWT